MGWHETSPTATSLVDAATTAATAAATTTSIAMPAYTEVTGGQVRFMCVLELNPLYAVLSSTVSFYAPCVVMILIYLRLYRYARKHAKCIREQQRLSTVSRKEDGGEDRATNDHKAAITLGVIMGVFLACWAPFFTMNVVAAFWPRAVPPVAFSLFTWLGYFNSTLNPVIYSIFNGEFREAFKRVLGRWCGPCFPAHYRDAGSRYPGSGQPPPPPLRRPQQQQPPPPPSLRDAHCDVDFKYPTPALHCTATCQSGNNGVQECAALMNSRPTRKVRG